jgi:hypothetical protein
MLTKGSESYYNYYAVVANVEWDFINFFLILLDHFILNNI